MGKLDCREEGALKSEDADEDEKTSRGGGADRSLQFQQLEDLVKTTGTRATRADEV